MVIPSRHRTEARQQMALFRRLPALDALSLKDSYPLPRMDECIDSLGDVKFFTALDCNWGFWEIPIREQDRDKTTFTCHSGTFRFKKMPFGLTTPRRRFSV